MLREGKKCRYVEEKPAKAGPLLADPQLHVHHRP